MASPSVLKNSLLKNLAIGVVLVGAVVVSCRCPGQRWIRRGLARPRTGHRYVEGVRAAATAGVVDVGWDESATLVVPMDSPRALALDARDRIHVIGDRLAILAPDGEVACGPTSCPPITMP